MFTAIVPTFAEDSESQECINRIRTILDTLRPTKPIVAQKGSALYLTTMFEVISQVQEKIDRLIEEAEELKGLLSVDLVQSLT